MDVALRNLSCILELQSESWINNWRLVGESQCLQRKVLKQ